MLKVIRALHIIGVVLFFGSILAHAVTSLAEGVQGSAQAYLVARQIVDVATWYLTLPGLVLLTVTGVFLVIFRNEPLQTLRPHLMIVGLILLNAIFMLFPTGQALLSAAKHLGNKSDLSILQGREALFGGMNILLCLAAIFTGVIKSNR